MIDLKETDSTRDIELPRDTGETFDEEGQLVVQGLRDGLEVARRGTSTTGLRLLGFSKLDTISPANTRAFGAVAVIPATAPFTVAIGHTGITIDINTDGDVRVIRTDTDAALTLVSGAPAAGEFQVSDAANGELTFNSAEAGVEIEVFARVTMTARERDQIFQQRHINSDAQEELERVGIIHGTGEIFTDQFDQTRSDYDTGTLRTGPGGVVTTATGGTDISGAVTVTKLPTVDDPLLGLRFNLPA